MKKFSTIFLSALALFAIAGLGFLFITGQTWVKNYQTHQEQLALVLQQQNSKINQLQQTLSAFGQQANLGHHQQNLAEIAYLIDLANLQLIAHSHIDRALTLLKTAKNLSDTLNDASATALKQALAQNIADLQTLQNPDVTAIFNKINTVSQAIFQIETTDPAPFVAQKTGSPWYERLGLVIVHHHPLQISTLITPAQKLTIKENCQTQLLLAQWALSTENTAIYQQSLNTVSQWINQYFPADTNIKNLTSTLNALQKLPIQTKAISISASVDALQQLLRRP